MSFTGKWNLVIQSPIGKQESMLELAEAGSQLTGRQSSSFGSGEIQNGAVNGNRATWTVDMTSPIKILLEFSATLDGDAMYGVVKAGSFGDSKFQGSRA